MRCVIDEPSDHAGRKLTRHDVVDAMNRRLRDGQLTVKRPHRLSRNRRKDASDLDIYLERVTGIEPALSAWEADVLPLNYTRAAPRPCLSSPRHRTGTNVRPGPDGKPATGSRARPGQQPYARPAPGAASLSSASPENWRSRARNSAHSRSSLATWASSSRIRRMPASVTPSLVRLTTY